MTVPHAGLTVDWLGYATARVEWPDGTVAYTDPGRYGVLTGEWTPGDFDGARHHPPASDYHAQDADLVVVTHAHHYDPHGIERVAGDDATVVVYEGVSADAASRNVTPVDALDYDVVRVAYGDSPTVAGVDVQTVRAETAPDEPGGTSSHPPGFGCGFALTREDTTVFYPGDSDALAAHGDVDPEVFLPPLSRRITMGETEAADLAERLDPELVVPSTTTPSRDWWGTADCSRPTWRAAGFRWRSTSDSPGLKSPLNPTEDLFSGGRMTDVCDAAPSCPRSRPPLRSPRAARPHR